MADFNIAKNFKHVPVQEEVQLKAGFTAILNDLTAIRASIVGITAQLDTDGGVTETDYAATFDPDALELMA